MDLTNDTLLRYFNGPFLRYRGAVVFRKIILVALLSNTAIFICSAQMTSYGNNPTVGKYYDINGFKMYCEIYGTGKPLLLIHGNGGSISSFSKNIPFLASKYKVIAVDSRAQGKSIDEGDSLSFEMMADDCAALLSILKIDSSFVVGWSDGGIIALLLAIRHPEKVKKLASTGANLWPDSTAVIPPVWKQELAIYKKIKAKSSTDPQQKNSKKLFLLDWFQPNITLAQLNTIKCPSLIICGDHDVINPEHTVLIYKNIHKANLWILPHSGHGTLKEHADDFNSKVDEFFRINYK